MNIDNEVVLLRQAIVSPQLVLLLLLRDETMGEQKGLCIKGQLLNFNLNHQIGRDYLSIKILSMSQDLITVSLDIYLCMDNTSESRQTSVVSKDFWLVISTSVWKKLHFNGWSHDTYAPIPKPLENSLGI